MNKTLKQYLIALGFGLLFAPLFDILMAILPDIGWHFLTVLYIEVFVFQVLFYILTTDQKIGWTILNYILNFILWTAELVILHKAFGDTQFYEGGLNKYAVPVLGSLLWATNKILIDLLFSASARQNAVE